jgi:hypothetical protein
LESQQFLFHTINFRLTTIVRRRPTEFGDLSRPIDFAHWHTDGSSFPQLAYYTSHEPSGNRSDDEKDPSKSAGLLDSSYRSKTA